MATALRGSMASGAGVLRRWEVTSLIAGGFLGGLASVVVNLLLTIYVYRETGSSPVAVSVLFVITFLPNLVVAPLCSGLADRFNRRLLLAACALARAGLCALLFVEWPLPVLLLLAFLITSASAVAKPARYALVAYLCAGQQRIAANSLLMIVSTTAGVLGGALAGLLNSEAGRRVFLVMAAVSTLGALLDGTRFRDATPTAAPPASSPDEEAEPSGAPAHGWYRRLSLGLSLVRRTPLLASLTISTTVLWFGLGMQEPLLVVYVDRALGAPDSVYAYLSTIGSVGGIIGAILATPLSGTLAAAIRTFSMSLVLAGASFLLFAVSSNSIALAFVLFGVFSATYGISNVIDEYLEQEFSPDHLRATVISAIGAIGTLGYLLGGATSGITVTLVGVVPAAAAVGFLVLGAGMYALAFMRTDEAHL